MSDYHRASMLPLQVGGLGLTLASAAIAARRAARDRAATEVCLRAWDRYERCAEAAEALSQAWAAEAEAAAARAEYEASIARIAYEASLRRDS